MKPRWVCGLTTVPERFKELLPRTLKSLEAAGFPKPRLFVDGCESPLAIAEKFRVENQVTTRWPKIRTYGNWVLGLAELFIREPVAEFYAMFQDDFVCVRNLREYLERTLFQSYRERCYWNLYTFPTGPDSAKWEQQPPPTADGRELVGFYPSNQRGWGAVALVFHRDAVMTLLSAPHLTKKAAGTRSWFALDGGVVQSFRDCQPPWREMIHWPSPTLHTGLKSSMNPKQWEHKTSFPGEDFDALTWLDSKDRNLTAAGTERFQILDGHGQHAFMIELRPDGTASKSHASGVGGRWRIVEGKHVIQWDDGWRDEICGGRKFAYSPANGNRPVNAQRAVPC
jgi:hypothetical protein